MGVGAACLGLTFAKLARLAPRPYAYTRMAHGDFAGFLIGWGYYWTSIWALLPVIAKIPWNAGCEAPDGGTERHGRECRCHDEPRGRHRFWRHPRYRSENSRTCPSTSAHLQLELNLTFPTQRWAPESLEAPNSHNQV